MLIRLNGCYPAALVVSASVLVTLTTGAKGQVTWSTYMGDSGADWVTFAEGLWVDVSGQVTAAGWTGSSDFPVTPDAWDVSHNGGDDVFITVLDPHAVGEEQRLHSTFLGGSGIEWPWAVVRDAQDRVIVVGNTTSDDFPVTPDAYDQTYNGDVWDCSTELCGDGFLAVLNASLTELIYSTYIGTTVDDLIMSVAVRETGDLVILGVTHSPEFPTTPGAWDTDHNGFVDGFVAIFDWDGEEHEEQLAHSTYVGGSQSEWVRHVALDAAGNVVVSGSTNSPDFPTTASAWDPIFNGGGRDGFVTMLDASLTELLASTYLGGGGSEWNNGLAVDPSGVITVAGSTDSADFPTTDDAYDQSHNGDDGCGSHCYDGYVAQLDPALGQLLYSTFVGGSGRDTVIGVVNDASGGVTISGNTASTDYPTTAEGDTSYNGGPADIVVTRLDPTLEGDAQLVYSTFIGGSGADVPQSIAAGPGVDAVVGGGTNSQNFPTTPEAYDPTWNGGMDAFMLRVNMCAGDVDGSGAVDVEDLVAVILAWSSDDPYTDTDADGTVDVQDLVTVILAWGPCS